MCPRLCCFTTEEKQSNLQDNRNLSAQAFRASLQVFLLQLLMNSGACNSSAGALQPEVGGHMHAFQQEVCVPSCLSERRRLCSHQSGLPVSDGALHMRQPLRLSDISSINGERKPQPRLLPGSFLVDLLRWRTVSGVWRRGSHTQWDFICTPDLSFRAMSGIWFTSAGCGVMEELPWQHLKHQPHLQSPEEPLFCWTRVGGL